MGHVAIPSYKSGFYSPKRGGVPKYPELWRGCVGAWCPSLGPTGLRLMDQSLYGNHGTLTNMEPASDWVVSNGVGALEFDGTNEYVDLSYRPLQNVSPRAAGCVSIWFSATAFSRSNGLFGSLDLGDRLALFIDSSNNLIFDYAGSSEGTSRLTVAGLSWSAGELYNIVATSGMNSGMRLYRNGVIVGSNAGNSTIASVSPLCYIGTIRTGSWEFQGRVFSCSLWNRALTDSQCVSLYRTGHAGMYQLNRLSRSFLAGSAPSTVIPKFVHHYRQQGVA